MYLQKSGDIYKGDHFLGASCIQHLSYKFTQHLQLPVSPEEKRKKKFLKHYVRRLRRNERKYKFDLPPLSPDIKGDLRFHLEIL